MNFLPAPQTAKVSLVNFPPLIKARQKKARGRCKQFMNHKPHDDSDTTTRAEAQDISHLIPAHVCRYRVPIAQMPNKKIFFAIPLGSVFSLFCWLQKESCRKRVRFADVAGDSLILSQNFQFDQ
jgi:hypothetical protein